MNKNELAVSNDMIAIALKAWTTITEIVYRDYDQKAHASALTAIKQIMQVLVKKLEKAVKMVSDKGFKNEQDDRVQIRMAVKAILHCT